MSAHQSWRRKPLQAPGFSRGAVDDVYRKMRSTQIEHKSPKKREKPRPSGLGRKAQVPPTAEQACISIRFVVA